MRSYKCASSNLPEAKQIKNLSTLLKIVSEKNRLELLCILKQGEQCVCEIMKRVDMSQSLVSHHLKDLKDIDVVTDEKRGLYVFYSLTAKGKNITDLLFKIKL